MAAPPAPPCTLRWEAYPPPSTDGDADPAAPLAALAASVADVAAAVVAETRFLWHADALAPLLSTDEPPPWWPASKRGGEPPPPCVWGELSFGDAVGDEWFAAAVLAEATRVVPGAVVQVWDDDGAFLLIEAAPALPRWLRPDTSDRRVWLAGGRVHIVPPTLGTRAAPLTVAAALAAVRDPAVPTDAGEAVHAALARRLGGARAAAAARPPHAARALLPRRLAGAVVADPGLAAALAASFLDADDAGAVGAAARAAAAWGVAALTPVVVRLPRLRYAALAAAPHAPPKGWPAHPVGHPDAGAADVGAKLAAAAEALAAAAPPGRADGAAAAPPPPLTRADVERLPGWKSYLAALLARGALAGEAPGSAAWQRVVGAAADRFAASAAARRAAATHPAVRLMTAAAAGATDEAVAASGREEEGDLAWLRGGGAVAAAFEDVGADARDAARAMDGVNGGDDNDGGDDPAAVAAAVRAFVEKASRFEGATPPKPRAAAAAAPSAGSAAAAAAVPRAAAGGLDLDADAFWEELGACLGVPVSALTGGGGEAGEDASSDEGSSFYSGASSGTDDDDVVNDGLHESTLDSGHAERVAAEAARLRALTAATGRAARGGPPAAPADPDSDDEAAFAAAYEAELGRQLAGTTLGSAWGEGDGGEAAAPAPAPGAPAAPSPLAPVDVDAHLVESLLASYAGEGGLGGDAGPAGVLAAQLGVRLDPK